MADCEPNRPNEFRTETPPNTNSFNYNGTDYASGDTFVGDACETKGFFAAYYATNPDGHGFSEGNPGVFHDIECYCPTTVIEVTAQPPGYTPPVEANPATTGGDSATQQGAPIPPVAGSIGSTGGANPSPDPTEEPTRPPEGEPDPTHGDEQTQDPTTAGDPVDIFNGAFYLQETDVEIPNTILPFSFIRVYQSGAAAFGPFGWNWDHNYNLYLRELNTGDMALWRNLHEDIFKFDGLNFEPPRGIFERLEPVVSLAQVYEIAGEGGTVMRFERPAGWIDGERIPVIRIQDRHGNTLNFTYGPDDKLAEVRDDDDRFMQFEYDLCGLLVAVSDHAGRKYIYEHDEQTMHLTSVTSPPTTDHPDGITKTYHYEQPFTPPELRHNILRVEDSQGNVYLENTYEQDPAAWHYARVTEQLYGGFLYQFRYTQLQWVPDNPIYINIPALRVEMMNPDFGLETYTFNYRGDLLDRRYRLNKDNSFRVVVWQYEFDEQGNLSITTRPDGSQEIDTYDFGNPDPRMRGNLLQKELTAVSGLPAPSRIIWQAKYEPTYQLLTEEKNELGSVSTYKYDFDINPEAITNSGKLVEVVHPDVTLPAGTIQSGVTLYETNDKGQVTATILPTGVRQEMVYGTAGAEKSRLIKQIFDVGGLNIENKIKYDGIGFETETIDGNGNSTQKVFNSLGLFEKTILSPVDGVQAEYRLHYDTDKKVIASERPKGEYTDASLGGDHIIDKFERDVLGYPTKYLLSSNTVEARTLKVCPDFRGFPVETINPDGSRVKRIYDERGLLVKEEVIGNDGIKLTSKKAYDRSGKLLQETNPFGLITKYEYDGFSRISQVTLSNNTQIKYKWLAGDLLASEEVIGEDGFGNNRQLSMKVYTYDEKGRRITETVKSFRDDPATAIDVTTTFFFDNLDRIEQVIDNREGVKTFQYDGLGRLIIEIDPLGNEEHYTYDNNGNLIQTDSHHQEPDGSVSVISEKYTYDARNRKIETVEPDGAKFVEKYDDRNLVVSQTNYSGIIKQTTYNSFHDRTGETHDVGGLSITQHWLLDNMSRIHTYIDPTGQISKYHFDSVGRIFKIEYPNGFSSTRVFNNVGQVIEEVLGSGVKFEYGYDSANRVVNIKNTAVPASVNQVQPHEFSYDGLDRVVSAKIGVNEVVHQYDSTGRLLLEKTHGSDMACNYDDNAGTVEKIWPDGRTEKYSHDLNGVITTIEETVNGSLGTGANLIASLKPSGPNYLGEASYQGELKIVNRYDERKRLVELAVSSPAGVDEKIKYRYDKANRRQVEAILGQKPKISYFEFDNKYRLVITKDSFAAVVPDASTQAEHDLAVDAIEVAAAVAAHEEKFDYTPADARTIYAETGSADKIYTYLSGHKIQSDGTNNYTYHPDGTLQSDGLFTYEADALGRVVTIISGSNEVCKIEYDAFGRPSIIKEVGKPDKSLNYLGGFVEQENENGIASRQISAHPLTGVPIAYHSAIGTHYTLFDGRYNLVGLANTHGDLLEAFRYNSFGAPAIYDAAGNTLVTSAFGVEPFFGGQRFLSSAGLYLSKRRLMNPVNGVFLSPDPKGYVDSSSLYVYVAQNPIDLVDPDGEFAFLAILAVMAIGAVVAGGINIARQEIQMAEDPKREFSWGEVGISMGVGAVVAPVVVVAPELAIPLAAYGVYGGISEWRQGHKATGAFDIATSVLPFLFKKPRNAIFGKGTRFGQMRGLGESASWSTRFNRFNEIENGLNQFGRSVLAEQFYHGTVEEDANSAISNTLAHLKSVKMVQELGASTKHLGSGLYFTREAGNPNIPGSASWWAQRGGSLGRIGSPTVLEVSIPRWRMPTIMEMPGVQIDEPQAEFEVPQSHFPFEGGAAEAVGRLGSWRIYNPGSLEGLYPTSFSGIAGTIFDERHPNELTSSK